MVLISLLSLEMTSEVLTDSEDLLHQLSAELGLGTLLEDPGPSQVSYFTDKSSLWFIVSLGVGDPDFFSGSEFVIFAGSTVDPALFLNIVHNSIDLN
jgi:hypothetical protein